MKPAHACFLAITLLATPVWAKCALVTYPLELLVLDSDTRTGVPNAQLTVLFEDRVGPRQVEAESDPNGRVRVNITASSADGVEPDGSDRCTFVLERAEVQVRKEGYLRSNARIQPLRQKAEIVVPVKKATCED